MTRVSLQHSLPLFALRDRSYLVGGTALVGTKHNHIGSGVGELLGVELLVLLEKLQVGTTANQSVCK